MTIAYDARPLDPRTRHWGVGVVIDNLTRRLGDSFHFSGIAHDFPGARAQGISTWPLIPRMSNLLFEASTCLVKGFDAYWGTNHFLPALTRKSSLLTVHDLLLLKFPNDQAHSTLLGARLRSSIHRADRVVADSRSTADDLLATFPGIARKLEVGLLGFDHPGQETMSLTSAEVNECPYAVMLGAHRPRKNLELAIAAIADLRSKGGKLELKVTGQIHPCFLPSMNSAKEYVSAIGVLPKSEMFALLRGAVALVFPSLYEGFGFPILEAMAAGCPVLALDTPINREIAGGAARLLKSEVRSWSNTLSELSTQTFLRQELVDAGFLNLTRFSWQSTAAVYASLFSALAHA